ncbi:hypothetical protein [Epilithonimonas mollis]|nr:hypothetical protein [Epilithonimonas mollis]
MLSFKPAMKRYLTLLYISLSAMCFAQYQNNVFEKDQAKNDQQSTVSGNDNTFDSQQSAKGVPDGGEQEEGPGNPGDPVPINRLVPVLLLSGVVLVIYYQRNNSKINV